jgi:hypothetical protein
LSPNIGRCFPAALAILITQTWVTNGVLKIIASMIDGYVAGYIPGIDRWFFVRYRQSIREPTSESNLSPIWPSYPGSNRDRFHCK